MLSQLLSDIRYRLRALFSRASVEQELDDELRFHIEREAEKYERQGMSHEPALRRARLAFGGVEQVKEASRDMRGIARLESIVRDLRYAMRSLQSRPAFTLTVIATLAFGIGANTAIFTLVDAPLLRPLPVPHPEQLVIVSDPAEVNTNNVGGPLPRVERRDRQRHARERRRGDDYRRHAAGLPWRYRWPADRLLVTDDDASGDPAASGHDRRSRLVVGRDDGSAEAGRHARAGTSGGQCDRGECDSRQCLRPRAVAVRG